MLTAEIEQFARMLIKIRDRAIRSCDTQLAGTSKSVIALRWAQERKQPEEFFRVLISDCVDEALSELLYAIDQESFRLSFATRNGAVVDLSRDGVGELTGWYLGADGWRARYSQERFSDDYRDL